MKPLLYLLSGVLVAPGALFAVFIWMIQTGIDEGTRTNFWRALIHLFFRTVEMAVWAMYLLPVCFILWIIMAFAPKYQIVGAAITSLVAVASLIEFFQVGGPIKLDELFLPALSVAGLCISLWLIWNAAKG